MSKKILVVDDEKNIRMTLTHCFKDQAYEIEVAVNGEEALKKIIDADYDLILLDIKMPGMTGMQVLEKLRERGSKVDVIMMTAYGTIERAVEAMKLGAIDFISKPFTPEEIRNIVKDVLDRQTLYEENLETFKDVIGFAKKCLIDGAYGKAEEYLIKAVAMDVDAPEPHNLLGILSEYRKEIQKAQMHYRAALALDPSYTPATRNLERTVQWKYTQKGMELGDESNGK